MLQFDEKGSTHEEDGTVSRQFAFFCWSVCRCRGKTVWKLRISCVIKCYIKSFRSYLLHCYVNDHGQFFPPFPCRRPSLKFRTNETRNPRTISQRIILFVLVTVRVTVEVIILENYCFKISRIFSPIVIETCNLLLQINLRRRGNIILPFSPIRINSKNYFFFYIFYK